MGEESPRADRCHVNRPPRKKVTVIVERGEEGDSQAAVRHSVQQTMAGSRQKEIHPHWEPAKTWQGSAKSYEHHGACHESGEKKGVREPAVAPEVAVPDAESEASNVNIGNYRAQWPNNPDPFWRVRAVEAGPDAYCGHSMREYGCHVDSTPPNRK